MINPSSPWSGFAGVRAYDPAALSPAEPAWDAYASRLFRYGHYEQYYHNTVYSALEKGAALHRGREKLYKHIRAIYNPVARQNDLLVSLIYSGALDLDGLTGGAIPLWFDNPAAAPALRRILTDSRFGGLKSLYVRFGALYGDVGLKIVDEPARSRVRIEVIHPALIRDIAIDGGGEVESVTLEYARADPDGEAYTYTETIDRKRFRTFKNGAPHAFHADLNGRRVASWANPYGFVPFVLAGHKPVGGIWSMNAFAHALRKIDEINDLASLLNDQVRKSVNTMWYFAGVRGSGELVAAVDDKDALPAIYAPPDSQPHALIADAPLGDALAALRELLAEVERDMPELALQRIRENRGELSAPGVRAAFSDAIGRVADMRAGYDHALARALTMAVEIGGWRGYAGFEPFSLGSAARGDLALLIRDRPVIDESLSAVERLRALASLAGQPPEVQRLILRELGMEG
jgi:hypothetical protein